MLIAFWDSSDDISAQAEMKRAEEILLLSDSACVDTVMYTGTVMCTLNWVQKNCRALKYHSIPITRELKEAALVCHALLAMKIPDADSKLLNSLRDRISGEILPVESHGHVQKLLPHDDAIYKHMADNSPPTRSEKTWLSSPDSW